MSLLHQLLVSIRSKMHGEDTKEMDEQQQSHFNDDETSAATMEGGEMARGRETQPQPQSPLSPSRPLSPVARYSLHSHQYAYQREDERAGARDMSARGARERREEAAWRLGKSERQSPPLQPPQPHGEYKQRRSVTQQRARTLSTYLNTTIGVLTGSPVCACACALRFCVSSSEQTPLLSSAVATGGGRFGEPGFRVTMEPVRCFHEALREENEGEGDEAEDESDVDSICSQLPATASTPALTAASEAAVATAKATGLQHPKVQLHPLQASEREHLARLEAAWHKQLHKQSHSSFLEWWRSDRSAEGGFCDSIWRHKLLIGLVTSIFIVGQLRAAAGRVRGGWRR